MNQSQIHLALTHLPVILTLTGSVVLAISLFSRNATVTKVALYILVAASLFALPVFFSGEGAEETIEHLPGVSGSQIQEHETFANISIYIITGTGLLALVGLFKIAGKTLVQTVRYFVLFAAIVSSGLIGWTAHLGGQIRHTEISQATIQGERNNGQEDKD
jgi:uncharacterized membrane protein